MQVIFFNKRIKEFFTSLHQPLKSKADGILHLLQQYGNNLGMPYSRALGSGLFELRIVGENHIRFIYAYSENKAWILHGFFKKTNRILKNDLSYAQKQLKMLLQ